MPQLLIHSLIEFQEIILGALELADARHIVEVGSESGSFSERLVDWAGPRGGRVTTIDPLPDDRVRAMAARHGDTHRLVLERTPAALDGVAAADAYVLDGDHNYYVVANELRAIHRTAAQAGSAPLLFMHDVAWPWARRDLYYDPSFLPQGEVHEHTYDHGVDLDAGLVRGGFRSNGAYAISLHEGGPRNGVLTAIEDFCGEHPEYELFVVPAVFGLGVLFPKHHPKRDALVEHLRPYHQNPLLRRLEENRLRNYLRVIALQDWSASLEARQMAEARRAEEALEERDRLRLETERLAEENSVLKRELADLRDELSGERGQWYSKLGSKVDSTVRCAVKRK